MIRARGRALAMAVLIVAAAVTAILVTRPGQAPLPARPAAQRPTLLLLTSLPLMFGESFSMQQAGSPALAALERRYRVVPISVTAASELAKGRLLLMAQPRAQPAEDLVALDNWVRGGGRLLLLADPMLEWPSELPLGDPLRPPPMFMDTGLLAHWGLRLDAPDERGVAMRELRSSTVATVSPGQLFGGCRIAHGRLVADCLVGKGRAIVLADADLLDVVRLGPKADHNLAAVLTELASLEER